MTLLLEDSARLSASEDVLQDIRSPGCNLAIWKRSVPLGCEQVRDEMDRDIRFSAPLAELAQLLRAELSNAQVPASDKTEALIGDVAMLARLYCSAMDISAVELRLEIVTTDSCRKFHADYVNARLITTYAGTGTQWLSNDDAERVRQGLEPGTINTLSAGDVGLFKGKLATETPAIHRSPPISGTGEKRLLLVLNPPESR